jgi:hypothetical protein
VFRVHAGLRLAFHAIARNRELLTVLQARDARQAEPLPAVYLADAERRLLRALDDTPDSADE